MYSSSPYDGKVYPLPEDLEKIAFQELNEDPCTRHEYIARLRAMSKEHNILLRHPKIVRVDEDAFLLRFLRNKKFNLDRAFDKLKRYSKFVEDHPHLFKNLDAQTLSQSLVTSPAYLSPHRDRNGAAIHILEIKNFKPDVCPFDEMMKCSIYITEVLCREDRNQIFGFSIYEDLRGFNLMLYKNMKPSESRTSFEWIEVTPARMKGIHCIHQPKFMGIVWALVRPFMNKKLKQRVCLYGNHIEKLGQHVDIELLPPSFGGKDSSSHDDFVRHRIAFEKQHPFTYAADGDIISN